MFSESCKTETFQMRWLMDPCLFGYDTVLGLHHMGPHIVFDLHKHGLLSPAPTYTSPPQACYIHFTSLVNMIGE